ncbi:MAG: tetratricopeptide repeat protein [Verrucomicrobiota bacterium]
MHLVFSHLLLNAAQGWLDLGSHIEADAELGNNTTSLRTQPHALVMRRDICATAKKWDAAIAAAFVRQIPDHPGGWVNRSYALHELNRTAEVRDNLLREVDEFPTSATMRYNPACYECQLYRSEGAKRWLERAFKLRNEKKMKLVALDYPDQEPLWNGGGAL